MAIGGWREGMPQKRGKRKKPGPPPLPIPESSFDNWEAKMAALQAKNDQIGEALGHGPPYATPDSVMGQAIIKMEMSGQQGAHRTATALRKMYLK